MGVTVEDLKNEIKDYNYSILTDGDDSVAKRAIEKGELWVKGKIIQANGLYDDGNGIIRLIIIKRALYELYSYAENESVAEDKKEDAMELLKAYYGSSVDTSGYAASGASSQTPLPAGAIRNGNSHKREH